MNVLTISMIAAYAFAGLPDTVGVLIAELAFRFRPAAPLMMDAEIV